MNIRIFYKQTSQYNRCRPTIVDSCPCRRRLCCTKSTEHCIYTSKILSHVWSRLLEWKSFQLLLASDAIMHARCCVSRWRERWQWLL